MLPDYHVHTKFSRDGKGEIEEFLKACIERQIPEIGFSEHLFFSHSPDFLVRNNASMLPEELENYMKIMQEFKKNSQIPIKIGCEVDFCHELLDKIKETLGNFNFDFLIVSSDSVGSLAAPAGQWWSQYRLEYICKRYFKVLQDAINSGLFDIVGHIDRLKKYGFVFGKEYNSLVRETVELVGKKGMCIEVNASGLDKCKEQYPSRKILDMCFELGIPVTLGSDAHSPDGVGNHFKEIVDLIKTVGYDKVAVFEGRKRSFVRI